MKYILTNDWLYLKKYIKIILIFLLILNIYPLYVKLTIGYDFSESYLNILFLNIGGIQKINSLYELTVLLLIFNFNIFLTFSLILKDFNLGNENLFLRITQKKYIKSKIIILIFLLICLEIMIFVSLYLTYILIGANIVTKKYFIYFIFDILCKIVFSLFSITMYLIIRKYATFILNLLLALSTMGKIKFLSVLFIDNYSFNFKEFFLMIIIILVLYNIVKMLFLKKYNVFFERSDHYGD